MNNKRKRYIIYETTLGGLIAEAKTRKETETNEHVLFRYEPKKKEMSNEQAQRQQRESWNSRVHIGMGLTTSEVEQAVNAVLNKAMSDKYRDSIEPEINRRVLDTKIMACVEIANISDGTNRIDRFVDTEYMDVPNNVEYSTDLDEMYKLLDDAKIGCTWQRDGTFVYLEELTASIYPYRVDYIERELPKTVKRMVRKKLTYCLKNGKNIVPDEYLDKGEAGIKEWQEYKSSRNKNNSIEKKIVKQMLRDNKEYMFKCIETITRQIAYVNTDYWVPSLEVDGRFNKTKTQRLVSKLLEGKSNDYIIKLTHEEILSMVKGYWEQILTTANNNVKNFKDEVK